MQDILQHCLNGLSLGSIYALIALGYTMVYGILQMINFAHSDVYMVGAFAAYYVARWFGLETNPSFLNMLVLILASVLACAVLGLIIERFAYRPLRHAPKINVLITAIGVSLLLQYSGQIIFGADPKVFPEVMKDEALISTERFVLKVSDISVLFVSVAVMFILHFFIQKTQTGRAMRAVSLNPTASSLMGININKIIALTFVIGSSLAGVGSVLVGIKYPKIEPLMGTMIGMKAFVAAVLGGIGSLPGAIIGALFMGLSEEFVVAIGSSTLRDALAFGILILVLLFKPSGLMGKNQTEKV